MAASLRSINNHKIWIEVSGEGPLVVFIHGLGGTCNVFDAQVAALAGTHHVVAFDLTGHGMSPLTSSTTVAGWADDVVAMLDEFGAESATVVAHSLGTLVAQQVIASVPDRVRSAALLGPLRDLPDAARQAQRDRATLVRAEGMAAVAHTISRGALSEATRAARPVVSAFVKELLQRQSPDGYAAACEALAGSTPPDVSQYEGPVLASTGSDDGVSPPDRLEAFAAEFKGARTTVIDGIGHWSSIEAVAEVTDLLVEFVGTS